jgi:hypothetical protein
MTRNEPILLKCYDSKDDGRTSNCFWRQVRVLANRLEFWLKARRYRLTLGYSRHYDARADETPTKEFLVVSQ